MSHTRGSVVFLALGFAALTAACTSFDFLTEVEANPPSAADCGGCHVEIYAEFTASAHAQAWNRPTFVAATGGHSIEECLGCHAPASIFGDGTPRVRKMRREEGVTCLSCHFDQGAMVGPAESTALVDPHPITVRRTRYRTSGLCGTCHEGTYSEWVAAVAVGTSRKHCQDCHMGRVTRKATQGTSAISDILVSFEDEFEGRRHTFHIPLAGTIDSVLSATLEGAQRTEEELRCELVLTNELPHSVPTGDFGSRWIKIEAEARSATGAPLVVREMRLVKELGQALASGESRAFPSSFPPETSSLRVTVTTGKGTGPRATIFEQTLTLP